MFQVLAPARRDLAPIRERLRGDPSLASSWLPPGERWYQLGPREHADDRRQLRLTPDRLRWVSRRPPNPGFLQHVIAAAEPMLRAEAQALELGRALGEPITEVVWRLGNWSTVLPSIHPQERVRDVPPIEGPWTWLGRWLAGLCASEDPFHRALVHLLRTGVGVDAVHEGVISLFLPEGPPPPVFAADHPPLRRGLGEYLHRAIRAGNTAGVRAALLRGAEPADPPSALVAVFDAPVQERVELLRILLEAGADPERVGWAPLPYHAVMRDGLDALLAAGLDVDLPGPDGATALHVAIRYRLEHHTRTLLGAGADPNRADVRGWTPLHLALAQGNEVARQLLIDAGARNLPDLAGVGAAEAGERPSPPPLPVGTLPLEIATTPASLLADWLEEQGDPRGPLLQRELAGEEVPELRAETMRRIAALHPVLAEHCTQGMVQLEHGFARYVRSRAPEQDAGVLQLLQHPEGARVRSAVLCSVEGLDAVVAPVLATLELRPPGPISVELMLPALQRVTVRGCPSLALAHATLPWLAVRLPMTRERPSCPVQALDLPALRTLDLELAWVPDDDARRRIQRVLEGLSITSLVLQPVDTALIEMLVATALLPRLERLELRSLRLDGVETVLARAERFAHLELVLTVLEVSRLERHQLQRRLRAVVPAGEVRGESFRAEGGYGNR